MEQAWKNFVDLWSRLPLVGGLTEANPKAFAECSKEFAFLWIASISPILLSIIIELLINLTAIPSLKDVGDIFYKNVKAGEIFIFANALLAPVVWVLYKYNRDNVKFPNHAAFLFSFCACIVLCGVIFGLQRAGIIKNQILMNWLAVLIYPFAVLMRWLGLVYDTMRADFTAANRRQEEDLKDKLAEFSKQKEGEN